MSLIAMICLQRRGYIAWKHRLASVAASVVAIATTTLVAPMPSANAQEANAQEVNAQEAIAQFRQEFCVSDMQAAIDGVIQRPTFASASWGVVMESLDGREKLYSHNENLYFIPASNIKLLTTAAALQTLQFNSVSDQAAFQNWINITNRDSNNGYADSLLRRLGGPDVVRTALAPLGVDPNSFRQVDGSGLSRYNMAKPRTFTSILRGMEASPGRYVFYDSLPIAGQSGTLRNRFQGTRVQGRVRAKTGTLRGVRALSGYLEHPRRGTLLFSIMVNQPGQSGSVMLQAIDQMVLSLMAVEDC